MNYNPGLRTLSGFLRAFPAHAAHLLSLGLQTQFPNIRVTAARRDHGPFCNTKHLLGFIGHGRVQVRPQLAHRHDAIPSTGTLKSVSLA